MRRYFIAMLEISCVLGFTSLDFTRTYLNFRIHLILKSKAMKTLEKRVYWGGIIKLQVRYGRISA